MEVIDMDTKKMSKKLSASVLSAMKIDTVRKLLTEVSSAIDSSDAEKTYIETLRIHDRAKRAFVSNNIITLDVLFNSDPNLLLGLPNIGITSIERAFKEISDEMKMHPTHETLIEILRYAGTGVRHVDILFRRFGLNTGVVETLANIGNDLSMTRERVRQMEARAAREIKMGRRGKELRDVIAILSNHENIEKNITSGLSEKQINKIISTLTKYN